jgi:hypothetical protein
MKKNLFLLVILLMISFASAQSEDENPRPIDSSQEYDGKVLNQMERIDGEGDAKRRQEMEDHSESFNDDQKLPGYETPEEGYEEDVAW